MVSVLPRHLTSFVGREAAIGEVAGLLSARRFVTITGSGGCGKTRLAVEVARRLEGDVAEQAVFVDLGLLSSPGLVTDTAAGALGYRLTGGRPEDELVRSLGTGSVLLVLDNCEHVLDEVAALAHALLTGCPSAIVLATSREPVGVEGETTWRVPSLTLPPAGAEDLELALRSSEAGRLLLDRTALARPDLTLGAGDAEAMVTICRRLDGIPLAIELAAARLRSLAPAEVASRLSDRLFSLLDAGPRTAPLRQRTLDASIAWTYDLLDGEEQTLFRRLSVFASPFAAADAEAVCSGEGIEAPEVLGLLARLADRSMVQIDRSAVGERYRMLGSIRHYARERLAEAGEDDVLRDKHFDHHLSAAQALMDNPTELQIAEAARGFEACIGDMRAAMDHATRSPRIEDGLRLATSLVPVFVHLSRTRELLSRLQELLRADGEGRTRAAALVAAARLALYSGGTRLLQTYAAQGAEAARAVGDRGLEGEATLLLGWGKAFGDPHSARPLLSEGLALAREISDTRALQFGHEALGQALISEGDLTGAREALERARSYALERGAAGFSFALATLGYVETLMGRLDDAEDRFREAAELPVGGYDRGREHPVAPWDGLLHIYRGSYDTAEAILGEAVGRAWERSNVPVFSQLHHGLLRLALADAEGALATLLTPVNMLRSRPWFDAFSLSLAGAAAELCGDEDAAESHRREAMTAAEASGNPLAMCVASMGVARLALRDGDASRCRTLLREALRHAVGSGYAIGIVDALEAIGAHDVSHDAVTDGVRVLAAADAERERVAYARFPVERPGFDAAVGRARELLGDGFEDVWAAGRTLGLLDAVSIATRGEGRPARPPTGWESLTPAEVRVARLVAEGLTNPQIGEKLFISRRTVQSHLRHIFEKLGLSTRSELAAEVARLEADAEG